MFAGSDTGDKELERQRMVVACKQYNWWSSVKIGGGLEAVQLVVFGQDWWHAFKFGLRSSVVVSETLYG